MGHIFIALYICWERGGHVGVCVCAILYYDEHTNIEYNQHDIPTTQSNCEQNHNHNHNNDNVVSRKKKNRQDDLREHGCVLIYFNTFNTQGFNLRYHYSSYCVGHLVSYIQL
jgi:hypothetical protein